MARFFSSLNVSVRPSVRVEHFGFRRTDFREILYWVVFTELCRENSRMAKFGQK
jgi:hypothetical protein